jgi:hypothetical protein
MKPSLFTLKNGFLLMTLIVCLMTKAQAQPYKDGFENTTANALWGLVSDPDNTTNAWTIGSAAARSGVNALYISPDGGTNTNFDDTSPSVLIAYREITLSAGKEYSVFFDYKALGIGDSLYACWVDNAAESMTPGAGSTLPSWVATTKKIAFPLASWITWRTNTFTVTGTGSPAKLVFVWINDGNGTTNANQGAIIDNIQINELTPQNYSCDFDSPEAIAEWTLSNITGSTNKWVIGSAAYTSAHKSLYISSDEGATNSYANVSCHVTAVNTFTFADNETVTFSFDWMCAGNNADFFSVCWVTDTTRVISSALSSVTPTWVTSAALMVDWNTETKLFNNLQWKNSTFHITGNGRPGRLVFFWLNNQNLATQTPAAIDNLQIISRSCAIPTGIVAATTGTTATLTWSGNASSYEVMYVNTYTKSDNKYIPNAISPLDITNIEKGHYSFFVRGICGNDTSAWVAIHNVLMLVSEGCINFIDIYNTSLVTASYGPQGGQEPPPLTGVINYGGESVNNRHTIITTPSLDYATDFGLRTIPVGELASIRLGNHAFCTTTNCGIEALTYTFTVDSAYSILLLKYAIVLQEFGHPPNAQPYFKLKILDAAGNLLDNTGCGAVTFVMGQNLHNEWNYVAGSKVASDTGVEIYWKDWTTFGMNLQQYAGQTIKVQLITSDCIYQVDFGYAYFTLSCAKAAMQFPGCEGDISSVCAPDGFYYEWFKRAEPTNIVNTTQCYLPSSSDTSTYIIRCYSKESASCYFDLRTSLLPRIPIAQATTTRINCSDSVRLNNQSVIMQGGELISERVTSVEWVVTSGADTVFTSTQINPTTVFQSDVPYRVQLVAHLNGAACTDTTAFLFSMSSQGNYSKELDAQICRGGYYNFNGEQLTEAGKYTATYRTAWGCDSIVELNLTVVDQILENMFDTICQGENYTFEGEQYSTTGVYTKNLVSSMGCDSVRTLNLMVNPVMQMSLLQLPQICADDPDFEINYNNVGGGEPTKFLLTFDSKATNKGFANRAEAVSAMDNIVIPIPVNIRPDLYSVELEFIDERYNCDSTKITVPFEIDYPHWVIEQNWDDVIALLNSNYNGGYIFNQYQWYKNNVPVVGETKSYIYVQGGLEIGTEYKLQIRRTDDGVTLFTCPIVVQLHTDAQAVPTIAGAHQIIRLNINSNATVNILTATGVLVSSQSISPGNAQITTPSYSGVYIMIIEYENGISRSFKIVIN